MIPNCFHIQRVITQLPPHQARHLPEELCQDRKRAEIH